MARKRWSLFCLFVLVSLPATQSSAQKKQDRFQVAGHFGLLLDNDKVAEKKMVLPEIGGSFVYLFAKHVGFEADSSFYPRDDFIRPVPGDTTMHFRESNYSGPAYVGLFGIRPAFEQGGSAFLRKLSLALLFSIRCTTVHPPSPT